MLGGIEVWIKMQNAKETEGAKVQKASCFFPFQEMSRKVKEAGKIRQKN